MLAFFKYSPYIATIKFQLPPQEIIMPYSSEFLLNAYRTMRTIRTFEERVIKEFENPDPMNL
jgi:TPP-dependent pyruvate/acetoin dehydrogenase alpha subunit